MTFHLKCLPAVATSVFLFPLGVEYFFADESLVGSASSTIKGAAKAKWITLGIFLVSMIVLSAMGASSNPAHHLKKETDENYVEQPKGSAPVAIIMILAMIALSIICMIAPFIAASGCIRSTSSLAN